MIHNKRKRQKKAWGQVALHIFFIILSLCYILPLCLLISISFDGNGNASGFSLFPREFTTAAYEMLFANSKRIIDAYKVNIFYCVVGVGSSLVVMSLFAYALSRRHFKLRGILTFILFFTTLFSGGMVPSYVINTKYLHLGDTIWIYILPGMVSAWNVIVIRTYLQNLPIDLFESARLDGATEWKICFRIAIPLSTPVLASVGFLKFIDAWNNWNTSQIYIKNPELVSLQYLLKLIMDDIEMLEQMMQSGGMAVTSEMFQELANLETMRFAMAVVGVGPALLIFPFFQKYFAKGMTIGAVKG